ncbi:helix-turn-helix transcriptional regulator [Bacillus sp. 1P10SD]|uniref:helix-turn-helix domain-containing protein n=1 Tax=Bacillus sp. 1P10SD TaxID=3132265 RepID=UPI0039A590E2
MLEGKIIRFYREKYQMTQEQLGKGICSGTHISKIERLQTEYAPEILTLLSERLGINMDSEVMKLNNIKQRLDYWHDVIVKQLFDEMEQIYLELKQEDLIQISNYINFYKLLCVRFLLMNQLTNEAYGIIKDIQENEQKLSTYESNLYKHVLGIYYIAKHEFNKALQSLKAIKEEDYHNQEYYYHLAAAYHFNELPVMAYFYADKARQFFKSINTYLRVIDAEMLMLIQVKDDGDFNDTIKGFKNLIQSCDSCYAPDRKAKVLHNLAFEYYRRMNYKLASNYYYESMMLKDKESSPFLLSLEGYIRSSFDGSLLSKNELFLLVEEGLHTAKKINDKLYINLFTLLCYLIQNNKQEYHQYLFDNSLPMFEEYGFVYLIKRSKKELYNYYFKIKQTRNALKIADSIINN